MGDLALGGGDRFAAAKPADMGRTDIGDHRHIRLGKLQHARAVVENYAMALHRLAAIELPISGAVARQAGLWGVAHRDPFDRLLAAQARSDDLLLASTDPTFAQFEGVRTLA